jgi:hypothetical protein
MKKSRIWEVITSIGKKKHSTDADFTRKGDAEAYAKKVRAKHGNARVIISKEKKIGVPGVPIKHAHKKAKCGTKRVGACSTRRAPKRAHKTIHKVGRSKALFPTHLKSAPAHCLLTTL